MKRKIDSTQRRDFIKKISLTSIGLAGIPFLSSAEPKPQKTNIALPKNAVILFQGDSITDMGRDRDIKEADNGKGLGFGYPYQVSADLLGAYSSINFQCFNRGISGNKVFQLADRWDDDCLNLKPNILSILIGVNDFWHTLTNNYTGTAKVYEDDFRKLLDRTKEALPDVYLIIGQPYAIKGGSAINDKWFPAFLDYQKAAEKIAADYNAVFIPYQEVFDSALSKAPVEYWSPDGVHPTVAGSYLMKKAWLKAFTELK